jgi:hypothetical protein
LWKKKWFFSLLSNWLKCVYQFVLPLKNFYFRNQYIKLCYLAPLVNWEQGYKIARLRPDLKSPDLNVCKCLFSIRNKQNKRQRHYFLSNYQTKHTDKFSRICLWPIYIQPIFLFFFEIASIHLHTFILGFELSVVWVNPTFCVFN